MHQNKVWLCFLTLMFTITIFYTTKVGLQLYNYLSLSRQTVLSDAKWSIKVVDEEKFIPVAHYTFSFAEKSYTGEALFFEETVYNPWAAEESLKPLSTKIQHVWFSPKKPELSALQKNFPLKDLIYATILWILAIYFFWLGVYVAKTQR